MPNLKPVDFVPISPPPASQQVGRGANFAKEGEKRNRYDLPARLDSASPVGYRTRLSLTEAEAQEAMNLLSLSDPTAFAPLQPITEGALFEEVSLGLLTARQSTNYRGHFEVVLGPTQSAEAQGLLSTLQGLRAAPLPGASHTHLVFSRPYRTAFTLLLTLVGHKPFLNFLTVPWRIFQKRFQGKVDIPTIGYLQHLHLGILAESIERGAILASGGTRRALVHMAPFCGEPERANKAVIRQLEALAGLTAKERREGWRLSLVAQVGEAVEGEAIDISKESCRRIAANQMAFRSERIQPGVNQEEKAPAAYQARQDMDVPEELTTNCGRAAYNAFAHWTGLSRERAKELLLLERVDVLHPGGKERLRELRDHLHDVTDRVVASFPKWIDLPTGRLFSKNASRGRKAFALVGQRVYIGGLSKREIQAEGLDWEMAVRALGAMASRSAFVAEIAGAVNIPEECDLLGGICLMAGPVNQNDIGKEYFGLPDLLAKAYPDRDPTSLLVWTLKAKTVGDPVGNEEQLLNAKRKGALVDLRPGPHEVIFLKETGGRRPFRREGERVNQERAFSEVGNFVRDTEGAPIPGNEGEPWPEALASASPWA